MDGEHLLPIGEGKVLDRMHDLDAGIGDEDVDPAEGLDRLLDACVDLVLLGDVHADADRSFLVTQPFARLAPRHRLSGRRSTTRPPASTKRLAMP